MAIIKAFAPAVDFKFENCGSICLLSPLTPAATEWVNEWIGQDNGYQPYWPTVVIEPRHCRDILDGIAADGLAIV